MTMVMSKLATAEELAALPDDGFTKYELIRGEIRKMSPAGGEHGNFAARIARPLLNLEAETDLGKAFVADTGFFLQRDPDVVVAPDAAFVLNEALPPVDERRGFLDCVPTLVVEVVSPSSRLKEVMESVEEYLRAGVPLIWVAFPDNKTVMVDGVGRQRQIFGIADVLDGGDLLPSLRLPVADIYR